MNKKPANPIKTYQDLIVYQKAKTSTISLVAYYSNKKLGWKEKYLIDQLIRSSASVGANLAEGYSQLYKQDYRRSLSFARESSFELEYWIDLVGESRPVDKKFLSSLDVANNEVIKMLTTMMEKFKTEEGSKQQKR